jgi:hypothetical protein
MSELTPMVTVPPLTGVAVLTPGVPARVVGEEDGVVEPPQAESSVGAPTPASARPAAVVAPREMNVLRS